MTKTSFYTMVFKDGKKQAELIINGYSDGNYYYYRRGGRWFAIHPLIGLAIAGGATRKEAHGTAHSLRIQDALNGIYENTGYYKKLGAEFDSAILELKKRGAQQCI
jgi:hypothetical protein